jgi:hypothetical protein
MRPRLLLITAVLVALAAGWFSAKRNRSSRQPVRAPLSPASAQVAVLPAVASPPSPAAPTQPNPPINPYAAALREPGKSKRAWDPQFIRNFQNGTNGTSIQFELTGGVMASGTVRIIQFRNGEISYVSGELDRPEPGSFFILTPSPGSKAGLAAGVLEFRSGQTAYRIEPTGPDGAPELWQRRVDEVVCRNMALVDESRFVPQSEETPDSAE